MAAKHDIVRACGCCRPASMPADTWCMAYGTPAWLETYDRGSIVSDVFVKLFGTPEGARNAFSVHALRLCSYFLRTVSFARGEPRAKSAILHMCAEALLEAGNGEKRTSERLTLIAAEKHGRYFSLHGVHRWKFLEKFYAEQKHFEYKATNDVVTGRWETALRDLHRRVDPDRGYVKRLAVHELIMHHCTNMTDGQLYAFNAFLERSLGFLPALAANNDFLHLKSFAYKAGRARLRTKLLVVNEGNCTCYAKCVGAVGREAALEEKIWRKSFELHGGLVVCGACRLAPVVENTTVEKPRRTHSANTPEVVSCATDGCSSYKFLRLVVGDVRVTKTGQVHVRYAHRMFATCSVPVVKELCGSAGGPATRIYGMCFDGRRTCKKRFVVHVPAGPHESFRNTARWYRCETCSRLDESFGARSSLALNSAETNTCLHRWFKRKLEPVDMCRGCRLAALCRHMDDELFSRAGYALGRVRRLYELRAWLVAPEAWAPERKMTTPSHCK